MISLFAAPAPAVHASEGGGHSDAVAQVVFWLAAILLSAQVGGDRAARTGQPAELGKLLVGVGLGNLGLAGVSWLDPLEADPSIDLLARLGVLLLRLEVGLESTVSQLLRVGLAAVRVAAPAREGGPPARQGGGHGVEGWRARRGSNPRPAASKADALSN